MLVSTPEETGHNPSNPKTANRTSGPRLAMNRYVYSARYEYGGGHDSADLPYPRFHKFSAHPFSLHFH